MDTCPQDYELITMDVEAYDDNNPFFLFAYEMAKTAHWHNVFFAAEWM